MKRRKIGPGVYVIDSLETIEMEQWVIDERRARGLSVPPQVPGACDPCVITNRRLTPVPVDGAGPAESKSPAASDRAATEL